MHQNLHTRMQCPCRSQILRLYGSMYRASTGKQVNPLFRYPALDIAAQVAVRNKEDILRIYVPDDLLRRGGSDAHIADRL